jgi:hypothetical protein
MSPPSNASRNPTALATIPWASLGFVVLALGVATAPALNPGLLYDRVALERGE